MSAQNGTRYQKIELDNPVCGRRFHLAFEEGADVPCQNNVTVPCPHCGITLFEAKDHPPVILMREENLIKASDGTRPQVKTCGWKRGIHP